MKTMDVKLFKSLIESGYLNLQLSETKINDLNVFPVPDGDTGTNMKRTLLNGINHISNTDSLSVVLDELSRGMLLGARGNSGVILSQFFKGVSETIKEKEANAITWSKALVNGYKTAYSSVTKPVEGTILTVAREGIENILDLISEDTTLEKLFFKYYEALNVSLNETINKLDVLKETHVIDSGAAGFFSIIEGMIKYLNGEEILGLQIDQKYTSETFGDTKEFGFCTEFIIKLNTNNFNKEDFKDYLNSIGESIVLVQDNDLLKVHIHTINPEEVLKKAESFGVFIDKKIEDMSKQHNEILKNSMLKPHKKIAFVAVCQGEGIKKIYEELGCDIILIGGQTMNVAVKDFIEAFIGLNADDIIVLPNNKNITLSAKQAKKMLAKENIHIVETKSVVEGYFALSFKGNDDENINRQLEQIKTGIKDIIIISTARAIKDSSLNNIVCKKDDYICMDNKTIISSDPDSNVKATLKAFEKLDKEILNRNIIVILKGKNSSDEELKTLENELQSKYFLLEIGTLDGEQDIYDFVIGII